MHECYAKINQIKLKVLSLLLTRHIEHFAIIVKVTFILTSWVRIQKFTMDPPKISYLGQAPVVTCKNFNIEV